MNANAEKATLTREQRSANAKKASKTLSLAARRSWKKLPAKEKRARIGKMVAARMGKLTKEERSAEAKRIGKLAWTGKTAEERIAINRAKFDGTTSEQEAARAKKISKTLRTKYTDEERSSIAKARMDNFSAEQHAARKKAAREFQESLPLEEKKALAKKRGKAAWAGKTTEQISEINTARWAKHPERRIAQSKRQAARMAKVKADLERLAVIENGAVTPISSNRRGRPDDQLARNVFERWVEMGKPKVTVEISSQLAKQFYPDEPSASTADRQRLHKRIWATVNRLSRVAI